MLVYMIADEKRRTSALQPNVEAREPRNQCNIGIIVESKLAPHVPLTRHGSDSERQMFQVLFASQISLNVVDSDVLYVRTHGQQAHPSRQRANANRWRGLGYRKIIHVNLRDRRIPRFAGHIPRAGRRRSEARLEYL